MEQIIEEYGISAILCILGAAAICGLSYVLMVI